MTVTLKKVHCRTMLTFQHITIYRVHATVKPVLGGHPWDLYIPANIFWVMGMRLLSWECQVFRRERSTYPKISEDIRITVPIRRNLTGNAWQNAFCCRSTRVPVPVLYPFRTCSISVPYPFSIHSVLFPFCQCSIGKRSWNLFRKTRFPGTRLQDCFTQLKLFAVCVRANIKTINLHFRGENVSPVTWKIREEDCNVTSMPVTESFSDMIQSDW